MLRSLEDGTEGHTQHVKDQASQQDKIQCMLAPGFVIEADRMGSQGSQPVALEAAKAAECSTEDTRRKLIEKNAKPGRKRAVHFETPSGGDDGEKQALEGLRSKYVATNSGESHFSLHAPPKRASEDEERVAVEGEDEERVAAGGFSETQHPRWHERGGEVAEGAQEGAQEGGQEGGQELWLEMQALLETEREQEEGRQRWAKSLRGQVTALRRLVRSLADSRQQYLQEQEGKGGTRAAGAESDVESGVEDDAPAVEQVEGSDGWLKEVREYSGQLLSDIKSGQSGIEQELRDDYAQATVEAEAAKKTAMQLLSDDHEGQEGAGSTGGTAGAEGIRRIKEAIASLGSASADGGVGAATNDEADGSRGSSLEEELVRTELRHTLTELHRKHMHELQQSADTFLAAGSRPNAAGSEEKARESCGGWHAEQHFHFVKVYKECHARGRGQQIYFERLSMQLPGMGRKAIESHDRWWQALRFQQTQNRDLTQKFERLWTDHALQAAVAMEQAVAQAAENAQRLHECEESEAQRAKLHGKLQVLRQQKTLQDKAEEEWERQQQQAEEAQRAVEQQQEAERRALNKDELVLYKQAMEEQERERERDRRRLAEEKEVYRAERGMLNAERVDFRESKAMERERSKWKNGQAKLREQEMREQRIAEIVTQVWIPGHQSGTTVHSPLPMAVSHVQLPYYIFIHAGLILIHHALYSYTIHYTHTPCRSHTTIGCKPWRLIQSALERRRKPTKPTSSSGARPWPMWAAMSSGRATTASSSFKMRASSSVSTFG
jgi:hypothetical protein